MHPLNRREFFSNSGLMLGGMFIPYSGLQGNSSFLLQNENPVNGTNGEGFWHDEFDIASIPNFCSHEHWGSIESIGLASEQGGFRCDTTAGAQPIRPTSVWDLVLDPYSVWWMIAGGRDLNASAIKAGYVSLKQWWDASPQDALQAYKVMVRSSMMTGGFQCTRRGILYLYGIDIARFDLNDWKSLDSRIQENYSNNFSWYQEAMKKANLSELIRPVHPEFYFQEASPQSKQQELTFTHTILRVDPLLELWQESNVRRDTLSGIVGIEPVDPKSWREFIKRIFDLAAENHTTGIKQLQAYNRSLEYLPREDNEVIFRGELSKNDIIYFQDWVMHECCKQAHERNWVHQVHVGTNNIAESGPLPLEALAKRYPNINVVMIHCWPFLKDAGYLAKHLPNMYVDTCWLPVLNPSFLHDAFNTWLNYVPIHKIMLAHDSTHVEMAVGSSLFTRDILAEALYYQRNKLNFSVHGIRAFAADMLHNNAVRLYKVGSEFVV
jgi:predicted TIM-barrel fold metal-dependent hydrolase